VGCEHLYVNPLGSVPYKYEDKSRPIDDPFVNDFLSSPYFPMPTFGLVRVFASFGCWIGLQDVKGAFPCLLLDPAMHKFFTFLWHDLRPGEPEPDNTRDLVRYLYVHTHGLFGPRDLPYIWTMYMLFITMAATSLGIPLSPPYLDDIPVVMERRSEASWAQERISALLDEVNTPEKALKHEPPFQKGSVLGREFNTRTFTVAVPADKMQRFISTLRRFFDPGPVSRRVPLKALQELTGQAAFIGSVLHHTFNSYMAPIYALLRGISVHGSRRFHSVRLTGDARQAGRALLQDIRFFNRRVSINPDLTHTRASPVYTDASGRPFAGWGFASRSQFQAGRFYGESYLWDIKLTELAAVLFAVMAHAREWTCCVVPLYVDNDTVVGWLRRGRAKGEKKLRDTANAMLRDIFAASLQHDFVLEVHWIATDDNIMADALSRGDFARFHESYLSHDWHTTDRSQCPLYQPPWLDL